jgi:hypothetical protein
MVSCLVDVIDADSISPELLHQSRITLALVSVDERVVLDKLVGDPCAEVSRSWFWDLMKNNLPLMNHWWPSLVKNLDPRAWIVGIALTAGRRAARSNHRPKKGAILCSVVQATQSWIW